MLLIVCISAMQGLASQDPAEAAAAGERLAALLGELGGRFADAMPEGPAAARVLAEVGPEALAARLRGSLNASQVRGCIRRQTSAEEILSPYRIVTLKGQYMCEQGDGLESGCAAA